MKKLKLFAIALVTVFGLNSCSKECGHDFIQVDYSKDLVGTWTCLEPDYAAAYVFNADGTIEAYLPNGKSMNITADAAGLFELRMAVRCGDYSDYAMR